MYEVDAPLKVRYQRFVAKYKVKTSLEDFVELDDKIKFNSEEFQLYLCDPEHQQMIRRRFHNENNSILEFHKTLREFQFNSKELVRPSFDTYFQRLAELAASRSNCMKRGNGAIIVKDQRIISTGYNGTPFGLVNCNEGGC